jgi:hypothetical protein
MRYPVTVTKLLDQLPPFQDEWVTVKKNQKVDDIIREIIKDHADFKDQYDKIGPFFNGNSVSEIADNIFYFLKKNIRYEEEEENDQTTSIPAGILTRKQGDCKHYAILSGGILDALKRKGKNIDWYYRFASYDFTNETPHHVFTVINDRGREIVIDPTPKSETKIPVWILDKHIKPNSMALRKNIAGMGVVPPEVIETGIQVASNLFSNIFNNIVIGDQVPEYPIKSKNTLNGILQSVQSNFPDATSVNDAYALYQKALDFIEIAEEKIQQKAAIGKNTAVDETYKMMYQEVAETYMNYIEANSDTGSMPAPGSNNVPPPVPQTKSTNPLLIASLAGAGIFLLSNMGKPTPRKTAGFAGSGLLLALAVAGGVFFLTKKKGTTTQQKREALIDWADDNNEGLTLGNIFMDMTDDEIETVYEGIIVHPERPMPEGPLRTKFQAISEKYDIFT